MKRTLLYFLLAFIAVILAACSSPQRVDAIPQKIDSLYLKA